jgi:hypothetical protein
MAASDLGAGMECPAMCLFQTRKKRWKFFLNSPLLWCFLLRFVFAFFVNDLHVRTVLCVGVVCGVCVWRYECGCSVVCVRAWKHGSSCPARIKHACVRVAVVVATWCSCACACGAEFCS